ncbi:MAG: hypothetical protein IJY09_09740 [Lachnospiraceae bacterium]|nr:hypothetical protein [Lachnospiraceae bacterium]
MKYPLNGSWTATLKDSSCYPIHLPGTLDESNIGYPDALARQMQPDSEKNELLEGESIIATRFTRKHTYTGSALFSKTLSLPEELFDTSKPRIFLTAERARYLALQVNGTNVPANSETSISTPYTFELTEVLAGTHGTDVTLVFDSDNSYPGMPAGSITYSSAATDETQTNWNGILGEFCLYTKEAVFIRSLRAYPQGNTLTVTLDIDAGEAFNGCLTLSSEALKEVITHPLSLNRGLHTITLDRLPLTETISYWDEAEGNLHELTAGLSNGSAENISFGIRSFQAVEGHFALNGRSVFLRSEANCAEFPETGHPPMSIAEWEEILRIYRSYGVNHLRFHSHCPPEAAFFAADRLGMLMQPELSQWDPVHSLESEESYQYYKKELLCILRMLANHPSFVMLTLGNESFANNLGHARMRELVQLAKEVDATRLYACGSNVHYGQIAYDSSNDFFTAQKYFDTELRATFASHDKEKRRLEGYLNNQYPNACTNFDYAIEEIRKTYSGPICSFEVGQYEILPDFHELSQFQGISRPDNLTWIKENVEKAGMLPLWENYLNATGELSRLAYREEVEAALRTKGLSGISLLGLQDFPGQGTALVGMLNSHLTPKPYPFAEPEKFRAFFTGELPLVLLPKYTYTNSEILEAGLMIANYGKNVISGPIQYTLTGDSFSLSGELSETVCPCGMLTPAGTIRIPLNKINAPTQLQLEIRIGSIQNTYPIWVYPELVPHCPTSVHETKHLDDTAIAVLANGGTVYLTPDSTKEQLPASIQGQFTTDFWSVGTFPAQEGGMGLFIEAAHPVFASFPTQFHTNWQWWLVSNQRAIILPQQYESIVTQLDSYAYLRPMSMLFECRCGGGRLLVSSMGLQNLQKYPEAKALLHSVYQYLESDAFAPTQEISPDVIAALVH